ncbi:MAG: alpha-L-rhamnosidase C-terminal domain-containing protein [Eubacteriales bacterium]
MFRSTWITHPSATLSDNRMYLFRKTFFLTEKPAAATLNISAEARYKLFVNGQRAAFGPCRPSAEEKYYDTLDLADFLHEGENELYCEVLMLSDNSDMTHPQVLFGVRRTGNLLLALELLCGETEIRTDATWETAPSPYTEFTVRSPGLTAALLEENAHGGEAEWTPARPVARVDAPREQPYDWGIVNPMFVRPRPIPMLYQKEVSFAEAGDGYWIAKELTFGFPRLSFMGHGKAKVTYAEAFGQGGEKGNRLDRTRSFGGASDEILVDGALTFEPFWFRCARIVKIETEGDVRLVDFAFTEVGYPLTYPQTCDFGNETDNRLWKISVATLMRCMQESYEDCPYYEQLQYAMDTSLQMLFNYQLTDDDALARKAIHDFRLSQLGDGLLSSRYPTVQLQYIPSFSFYYIFMVAEHYRRFGDKTLVRENLRAIDGVLEWFDGCIDETGLLKRTMYWDFIDWSNPWMPTHGEPVVSDGCHMAPASAMYVYFLRAAAELADVCGRACVAAEYRNRADAVAAAIEKLCWNEEKGLYADDIAGVHFSQHMQVWCTLSGIADEKRAHRIMENALPLETSCTFAYAYFWFRALEQVGLYSETERMMNRLRGLLELDCTTIPETPDAPRSDCHAWGAIAIYEFAAVVLGVRTVSAAEKKIRIAPRIEGRSYAKGEVFTGGGKVWVDWMVTDGVFSLYVKSAEGTHKEIVLPNGAVYTSDDAEVRYTVRL